MSEENLTGQYEETYESLIEGLLNQGFGVRHNLLDETTIVALRTNLLAYYAAGEMYPAGIGRKFDFQQNAEVRGDVIKWIEKDSTDPAELILMDKIRLFVEYLNRTCYTGINDFEFHYAFYKPGSFYKRHLDQFKSDRGRLFSMVTYLNDGWQESDGGNLSIYLNSGLKQDIYPIAGRTVFFKSDETEHEVHAAPDRFRLSIAGWLKRA